MTEGQRGGCRIFPEELSAAQLSDPKRRAEIKVYNALKQQLGREWTVYYDVAWLAPVGGDVPRDGQTDFIVAAPDKGILLIEVKGGRIAFDGRSQQWTSTDRFDKPHDIDPIRQVREGKYALLEKLKSLPGLQKCWINIFHAAAFPNCEIPAQTPIEAPTDILIGIDDLTCLSEKIGSIFDYHRTDSRPSEYGRQIMTELAALLGRSIEFPNPLVRQLDREEAEIVRLTEEQITVLDALHRNRRVAVSGCAGSGKTFLAIEKALRLAHEGYRTLLTCYNRPLANHFVDLIGEAPGLTVDAFFGFCRMHARDAGIDLKPFGADGEINRQLETQYPETLVNVACDRPDLSFDAIVVDEGQDFREEWWIALEGCLKDRQSIFYVFYDDNQMLYRRQVALPDGMLHYRLAQNLRNARPIFDLVSRHYRSDQSGAIRSAGPEGRDVERISYSSEKELERQVGETLERYIVREKLPSKDIVVLTPKSLSRSHLMKMQLPGRLELVKPEERKTDHQVACSTIHSFKGLERKIVLVAELDEELFRLALEDRTSRCYVAFSRAQSHLTLIAKPEVMREITS